jgi:hypothetical protein
MLLVDDTPRQRKKKCANAVQECVFFLLTFSSFLFPGMPLLLVLEVVVRPADVAGEGEGVAPEGPEAGVADDQYVCFSQRMAAATLPLSQTFPVFLLVFFAVPSVHLCFTHMAVNVINLGTHHAS